MGERKSSSSIPDVQETAADLLRRVSAALPPLRDVSPDARVCVRPMPSDCLPIVGPLPGIQGVYVMVTRSGITLGPLLAQLLAEEIIVGQPLRLLAPYRPSRFAIPS